MAQHPDQTFDSDQALTDYAVSRIRDFLGQTLAEHGRAGLALCGGRSPRAIYQALSREDLEWQKVSITLTDDRVVPADHPDSNQRLLQETLLRDKAAKAAFVPILSATDPVVLAPGLTDFPWPQSLGLFGMGEDGHIASLFPEDQRTALSADHLAVTGPKPPYQRVSMAPSLIRGLPTTLLLVVGPEKAAKLAEVKASPRPDRYPAQLLLNSTATNQVLVRL